MTTKHEVIALHREHPDWTGGKIAAHLGCLPEYVSATLRRNGMKLPNSGQPRYLHRMVQREKFAIIAERMGAPEVAAAIRGAA